MIGYFYTFKENSSGMKVFSCGLPFRSVYGTSVSQKCFLVTVMALTLLSLFLPGANAQTCNTGILVPSNV